MITDVLAQHPWLWPLAWQSTACLAAGLAGSVLLRRRPVRAHQLLLLSLIAAILIPVMSHAVKRNQWGLFAAERTVSTRMTPPLIAAPEPATAVAEPTGDSPTKSVIPTQPVAVATSGVRFPWETALPLLWLGVTSILLVRLVVRFLLGLGLARESDTLENKRLADILDVAKVELGITTGVVVRASRQANSPVIWCWGRRPVLLVPADSCDDTRLDWASVLCHELAHWRRRDHVTGLLAELLACLLPWQPFSWLARRRLLDLSEEACDDWVLASGQVGTRYARTLLSLTPLGRAALVPAVVTTRTGLAGRIRRIIQDKCGNPRSGRRWTFAVTAATLCLAIGLAFAQPRLAQATQMVKSLASHGASIEQPASAVMIRGYVLDPNNKPLPGQPVRVTALPMTCYAVEPNDRGYFEVPWSSSWMNEGASACLVVQDRQRNLAGMVEVGDCASPVTIRLEPGFTLRGSVLDSSGRRIPKSSVVVFVDDPLQPQAPIAASDVDNEGQFKINALPRNHAYELRFRAPGYLTQTATLAVSQTCKDTVDANAVVLEPQNPASPIADDWSLRPNWRKSFDKAYRLANGEVMKLMKPPFIVEHQDYMIDMCLNENGLGTLLADALPFCGGFRWDGQLQRGVWYGGRRLPRIRSVMNWILNIPDYDFVVPDSLHDLELPKGDWIVRDGCSVEERLRALEEIMRAELGRSIRFEKRTIDRDTIVVTGRYAFTALPDKDPNRLCVSIDLANATRKGEADSLADLLSKLAEGINIAVDNRTEPTQTGKIPYLQGDEVLETFSDNVIDKEKALPALLDNLARQTGLKFTVEKQPAEVWFVVEDATR